MNMEFNKLLAAVLVAGITAMIAGMISRGLYHPETLEKNSYVIEVAEASSVAGGEIAAAPQGPEPIAELLAAADVAHGEKLAKVCSACHSFDKGGANRVGPNLFGVVGKAKASHEGFAYSDAMKAKGGNWDIDAMNAFLWNPKKDIPGTKMTFAGLKKPEDRAAVVKWLETLK